MKSSLKNFHKIIALMTALFTAQPPVSFPFVPQEAGNALPQVPKIEIPAGIGEIEKITGVSSSAPVIFHIQDAHANYDAQKNIQKILEYLHASGKIDAVLLEGGAGRLEPGVLAIDPQNPAFNLEVAEILMKRAELSGGELFLLERYLAGKPMPAYGLESISAYRANRDTFQKVIRAKQQSQTFLTGMDLQIERLTAPFLNPALKNFFRDHEAYETGRMDLTAWMNSLEQSAKDHLAVDLENPASQKNWPMLTRFSRLKKNEKYSGRGQFWKDKPAAEIIQALESVYRTAPDDFSWDAAPSFKASVQSSVFQQELTAPALFGEIEKLERELSRYLARTPQEQKIAALYQDYRALKKLFRLELTRKDYLNILAARADLKPSAIARRFQDLNESRQVRAAVFSSLTEMDLLYELALQFYDGAEKREWAMSENILKVMTQQKKNRVAIVTGGFHSEGLQAHFEAKGYSYALISPKIHEIGDNSGYLRSMLDGDEIAVSQITNALVQMARARAAEMAGERHLNHVDRAVFEAIVQAFQNGKRSEMRSTRYWLIGAGVATALWLSYLTFRPAPEPAPAPPPAGRVAEVANEKPQPVILAAPVEDKKEDKKEPVKPVEKEAKPPVEKKTEIDLAEKKRVWGDKEPPKLPYEKLEDLAGLKKLNARQLRWLLRNDPKVLALENDVAKADTKWTEKYGIRQISESALNAAEEKEYKATKDSIRIFLNELKKDGILTGSRTELDFYYFFFRPLFTVQDKKGKEAAKLVGLMSEQYRGHIKKTFKDIKTMGERSLSATYVRTFEEYLNADEWREAGGEPLKMALALSLLQAQLELYKKHVLDDHRLARNRQLELQAERQIYELAAKGLGKEAFNIIKEEVKADVYPKKEKRAPLSLDTIYLPQPPITVGSRLYYGGSEWNYSSIHREVFRRPGKFEIDVILRPWFSTHTLMHYRTRQLNWAKIRAEQATGVNREPRFPVPILLILPSEEIKKAGNAADYFYTKDNTSRLGDSTSQRADDNFSFFLSNSSMWKPAATGELQHLEHVFDAQRMKTFSRQFRELWESGEVKNLYRPDYGEFLMDEFLQKFLDDDHLEIIDGQLTGHDKYIETLAQNLRERFHKLPTDFQAHLQIPLLRYEAGKSLKLDQEHMSYLRADLYQSAAQLARDMYVSNTQAMIGAAYKQGITDTEGIINYVRLHILFRPVVERLLGRRLVLTNPYSQDSGRLSTFVNEISKRELPPHLWYLVNLYAQEEVAQKEALEFYNLVMGTELKSLGLNSRDEKLVAVRLGILLSTISESMLHSARMNRMKEFLKDGERRGKAVEFGVRYWRLLHGQTDLEGDELKREMRRINRWLLIEDSEIAARYSGYIIGQAREAVLFGDMTDKAVFDKWVDTTDRVIKVLNRPEKRSELRSVKDGAIITGVAAALVLAAWAAFRPLPEALPLPQPVAAQVDPKPRPVAPVLPADDKKDDKKGPVKPAEPVKPVVPEVKPPAAKKPEIDLAEKKRVWGGKEPPKLPYDKLEDLAGLAKLNARQLRWLLRNDPKVLALENDVAKADTRWIEKYGIRQISETALNSAERKEYNATKESIGEFLKDLQKDKIYTGNLSDQDVLNFYYFFFRPLFTVQDRRERDAARLVGSMAAYYAVESRGFDIHLQSLTEKSLSSTYVRTIEDYLNPDEWQAVGGERLKIVLALSLLDAQFNRYKEVAFGKHKWVDHKRLEIPAELALYRFYEEKGIGPKALEAIEWDLKREIRGPDKRKRKERMADRRPDLPQTFYITLYEDGYRRIWDPSTIHRERFYRPGDFRLGVDPNPWFPTHTVMNFHIPAMGWAQTRAKDVTGLAREPYFLAPVAIQLPSDEIRKMKFPILIPARPDNVWGRVGLSDRHAQRAEDTFGFFASNPVLWKASEEGKLQNLDQVFDLENMRKFAKQFREVWDSGEINNLVRRDYGRFLVDNFLQKFIDGERFDVVNGQLKGHDEYIDRLALNLRLRYSRLPYDFQVYLQIPLLRYEMGKTLKLDEDYMAYLRADLYQASAQLARDIYVSYTQAMIGAARKQGINDTEGIINYVRLHILFRPVAEKLLERRLVLTNPHSQDSGRLSAFVNEISKRELPSHLWYLVNLYAQEEVAQKEALELYNLVMGTEHKALKLNVTDEKLVAVRLGILLSTISENMLNRPRMDRMKEFLKDGERRGKAVEFGVRYWRLLHGQTDLEGDELKREMSRINRRLFMENSEVAARYSGYVIGQAREAVLFGDMTDKAVFDKWVDTTDRVLKVLNPKKRSEVRAAAVSAPSVRMVVDIFDGIIPVTLSGGEEIYQTLYGPQKTGPVLSKTAKNKIKGLLRISALPKQPTAILLDREAGITRGLLAALRETVKKAMPVIVLTEGEADEKIVAAFNLELKKQGKKTKVLAAKTLEDAEKEAGKLLKSEKITFRAFLDLSQSGGVLAEKLKQKDADVLLLTEQMYDKLTGIAGVTALLTAFRNIQERISVAA